MKVKDDVQYDIFRRVLAAVVVANPDYREADSVDEATKITNCAMKRLIEMEIVE